MIDIKFEVLSPLRNKVTIPRPLKWEGKHFTHLVLEQFEGQWSGSYVRITPTGRVNVPVANQVSPKFAKDVGESVMRVVKGG